MCVHTRARLGMNATRLSQSERKRAREPVEKSFEDLNIMENHAAKDAGRDSVRSVEDLVSLVDRVGMCCLFRGGNHPRL